MKEHNLERMDCLQTLVLTIEASDMQWQWQKAGRVLIVEEVIYSDPVTFTITRLDSQLDRVLQQQAPKLEAHHVNTSSVPIQ